jgi:hypothetical protein
MSSPDFLFVFPVSRRLPAPAACLSLPAPCCARSLLHLPRERRAELHLHLHRFENHQRLTAVDTLAFFDQHIDHHAGHGALTAPWLTASACFLGRPLFFSTCAIRCRPLTITAYALFPCGITCSSRARLLFRSSTKPPLFSGVRLAWTGFPFTATAIIGYVDHIFAISDAHLPGSSHV